MSTRQRLRRLIKEGSDMNNDIESQEYVPLLKKITRISQINEGIEANDDENNTLILKTGITRVTNTTFLNVLETKKNLVFNENELVTCILNLIQDEEDGEINWFRLADHAMPCFDTVFLPFPVQLDATNRQPEDQKVRAQRARKSTQVAPQAVAEKLAHLEGENARALESVYNDVLRSFVEGGEEPMPFFKLICDPQSFQKSVNNAFQMAFLIQSNLVRVFRNEAGETLITPLDLSTPFTSQKGGDNSVHAVTTLDYELWESTVSNYQIETSMICS